MKWFFYSALALSSLVPIHQTFALDRPGIVVDAIVATVNDTPITLVELGKRLSPPRSLTLQEASGSSEARAALDGLIYEKILTAEAERRNIRVSDDEIEKYVSEVAERNALSPEAFENALKGENRSLSEYKNQIRLEILRSKIAANYVRVSAAVTDEEVDAYIKSRTPSNKEPRKGAQIGLRQILLLKDKYTSEQAKVIFEKISSELENGTEFEMLAAQYSNAPDAKEGGDLGMLSEKDLSPEIFDAVIGLDVGETSATVSTPMGFHIFQVVDRKKAEEEENEDEIETPEVSEEVRAEVRKQLEREKLQSKMATFFESEIMKLHTVDKKI